MSFIECTRIMIASRLELSDFTSFFTQGPGGIIVIAFGIFAIIFYVVVGNIEDKIQDKEDGRRFHYEELIKNCREKTYSGEYKIYLDGRVVEDPMGINVPAYSFEIDEKNKLIRFTTNHVTTVNNRVDVTNNVYR